MPFFKFFKSSQTDAKHIASNDSDAASTTTATTRIGEQTMRTAGQGNNAEDAFNFLYGNINFGNTPNLSCQNKI
ncbi:hypothetical protein FBU59_000823 [Linderina macrospora]|uniref:Uncharacterized protein n=1 Tax=Linderina macrospora TaxID=4868 RepID=A0ACC1JFW1_9FUNG|nr:hypothetical protein FBU59_000823 [Linderina macrospora]